MIFILLVFHRLGGWWLVGFGCHQNVCLMLGSPLEERSRFYQQIFHILHRWSSFLLWWGNLSTSSCVQLGTHPWYRRLFRGWPGSTEQYFRYFWMKWSRICSPWNEGDCAGSCPWSKQICSLQELGFCSPFLFSGGASWRWKCFVCSLWTATFILLLNWYLSKNV